MILMMNYVRNSHPRSILRLPTQFDQSHPTIQTRPLPAASNFPPTLSSPARFDLLWLKPKVCDAAEPSRNTQPPRCVVLRRRRVGVGERTKRGRRLRCLSQPTLPNDFKLGASQRWTKTGSLCLTAEMKLAPS